MVIAVVGGAISAVAAIIGLVFLLVPGWQPEPAKGVELVESDVDREENIRADYTNDSPPERISVRASMLSVTLRNTSDDPVLITGAEVRFSSVKRVGCAYGAGGAEIKAHYKIKVPFRPGKAFTVKRKMKYTVPAHHQERVAFSIGPNSQPEGALPTIHTFTVVLHADNGARLIVPEATMLTPPAAAEIALESARTHIDSADPNPFITPGCIRKEAKAARKAVTEAKRPSPELRKFSTELTRIAQRL